MVKATPNQSLSSIFEHGAPHAGRPPDTARASGDHSAKCGLFFGLLLAFQLQVTRGAGLATILERFRQVGGEQAARAMLDELCARPGRATAAVLREPVREASCALLVWARGAYCPVGDELTHCS